MSDSTVIAKAKNKGAGAELKKNRISFAEAEAEI